MTNADAPVAENGAEEIPSTQLELQNQVAEILKNPDPGDRVNKFKAYSRKLGEECKTNATNNIKKQPTGTDMDASAEDYAHAEITYFMLFFFNDTLSIIIDGNGTDFDTFAEKYASLIYGMCSGLSTLGDENNNVCFV